MRDLEQDLENQFIAYVEAQGGLTFKWAGSRRKLDRIVVTHTGVMFVIEFKRPGGGKLTTHQQKIFDDLELRGLADTVMFVVNSLATAMSIYDEAARGELRITNHN